MGVPEHIRKVRRPPNTQVLPGKGIYAVRERRGCVRRTGPDGKVSNVPVDGGIIGYIYEDTMEYVPGPRRLGGPRVDLKDWARPVLCDRLCRPILDDLMRAYPREYAVWLYVVALLRCIYPGVTDHMLLTKYRRSFCSEMYPGMRLSKNTVCSRLQEVGEGRNRMIAFMRERVSRVQEYDRLIIDGTLQQDESHVNPYSRVSRKTRKLGYRQYSLMYAFSVEDMEPVCSQTYPGNVTDSGAVRDFIRDNGISKGIIVADKGFGAAKVKEAVTGLGDGIHYLVPLKRDSKAIAEFELYRFDGILEHEDSVEYRKVRDPEGGRCLYAFRDTDIAADEERHWLVNHPGFEPGEFEAARMLFGLMVLESDIDMPAELAYQIYDERWYIEILFKFYHTALEFEDTREQNAYSVLASSFVDFLSAVMGSKLNKCFRKADVLKNIPYGDVMDML